MKPKSNPFLRSASLAATIALSFAASAFAATWQWDGGASTGNWQTPANWNPDTTVPPFNATATDRLNVNGAVALQYSSNEGTTNYGGAAIRGVVIGSGSAGSGTMTITGGTFSTLAATGTLSNASDAIGNSNNNTGILNISGGTFIGATAGTSIGLGGGIGRVSTLNVNSGSATLTTVNYNTDTGTINLNGGTLALNNITHSSGNNNLNLNGGTLKARQTDTAFIGAGLAGINAVSTSTLDTAGFNLGISSPITGSATINVTNGGNLTLTAQNPFTGILSMPTGILSLAPTAGTFASFSGNLSGNATLEIAGPGISSINGTTSHTGGTTVLTGANLGGEGSLPGALTFQGTHNFYFNPVTTGTNQHFRAGSINATTAAVSIAALPGPAGTGIVVLEASGGITGTIGTNFLGSSRVVLSYNIGQTQLLAAYTPASLTWKGADVTNPTFWDTTTTNWDNASSPDTFFPGDNVLFDDNATGYTVALQGTMLPGTVTFDHTNNDYTVSGGAIGGTASLIKTGSSSLFLNNANSYTGTTTITNGTLVAGNIAALGTTDGGTTVSGTGVLDINNKNLGTEVITISGEGAGSGALVNTGLEQQNAIGRLVLAGDATIGGTARWDLRNSSPTLDMGTGVGAPYTLTKVGTSSMHLVGVTVSNPGNIDVTEGKFAIETSTTMGGSSANTITVRGNATLSSWQAANPISWSLDLKDGSTLFGESAAANSNNTWTGPVTLEDFGNVTVQAGGTMTIAGKISGAGSSITKTGNFTTLLAGSNDYTGTTTVSAGILALQNPSALGGTAAGTSVTSGARVELDNVTITGEEITLAGNGGNFLGALQGRTGSSNWNGNVIVDADGTRIGTQANATLEVSGVISSTAAHNVIFRPNDNSSPVILTGPNTYTGPTSIVGGVVSVSDIGSVAGGASNLGSPTSVANGTIRMSVAGGTGTLRYTGTGETTNRVVDLFAPTNGAFIEQAGTGLLKFTSDFTATGVGTKLLVLAGSTAGTGEIAGAVVDNPTTGSTLLTTNFAAAATTITLNSVNGIIAGASISGTGIALGTTVTAVNTGSQVVTLSTATTGAGTAGSIITVDGVTNSTNLRKDGSSTWTLSGANTNSGSTLINAGTLVVSNASGLGSTAAGTSIPGNGLFGTLALTGGITITGEALVLGARQDAIIDVPHVSNVSGNNTWTGDVTFDVGGLDYNLESQAGLLTMSGQITAGALTGNRNLKLMGAGNGEVSGAIINGTSTAIVRVTKVGAGTWTLSGTNLYTGATNVNQGTLVIGSTGSIDASTALTVAAGAELDTTAKSTHTLPATVTIGLDGDAATSGLIDATGQALDIDAANVTFNVTGSLSASSYVLAKYGSISGAASFASITPPSGYTVDYGTGSNSEIKLVLSAASDFDTWLALYPSITDPNDKLPTADPDGDGLTNFEEYAFGLAPNSASSVNPITQQLDKTSGVFKYSRRNTTVFTTGVNYTYEYSTTLSGAWNPLTLVGTPTSDSGNPTEIITVTVDPSLLTNPKLFVRVKALK